MSEPTDIVYVVLSWEGRKHKHQTVNCVFSTREAAEAYVQDRTDRGGSPYGQVVQAWSVK